MNNIEFSNEFDILYNNIMSNSAPGFNEYEKSVFLTQSQESLVLDIYSGKFNGDSFESTEEVTNYIRDLVKQATITESVEGDGISENSTFFKLPSDVWLITYESVKLNQDSLGCKDPNAIVVPTTQDTFYSTNRNPFRGASYKRVLRLSYTDKVELISKYKIDSYTVRYLSKPSPIILDDLTGYGVSINGITDITECKLNPLIHRAILIRAVNLAKEVWLSGKTT